MFDFVYTKGTYDHSLLLTQKPMFLWSKNVDNQHVPRVQQMVVIY